MIKSLAISGFLLLAGLVNLPALALPPAIAADFSKPGPFAVGFQQFTVPDVSGKHPLATMVWYPAAAGTAPDPATLKFEEDAPPATTGPYPLVVLIPGSSMPAIAYGRWGQLLASYGFVAVASTYDDAGVDGPRVLYNRPSNVVRVIGFVDTLTAPGGKLAGLIDTSRIGVWGQSTGGTTALQIAGARIDFKALAAWCAANEDEKFGGSCQFVGHEPPIAALYGAADPFAEPLPAIADNRVAALVLAAPGDQLQVFGPTIAGVRVPTLIMVSAKDEDVKPDTNALWAYDGIGSDDKALAVFDEGGHMLFTTSSAPQFVQAQALTIAFFLDVLKGDPLARSTLLPNVASFTGLSFKTTRH